LIPGDVLKRQEETLQVDGTLAQAAGFAPGEGMVHFGHFSFGHSKNAAIVWDLASLGLACCDLGLVT